MHTYSENNPTLLGHILIERRYTFLNANGALSRVHCARELGKNTVACGVCDAATVLRDLPVDDFSIGVQQTERPSLIGLHQLSVCRYVSTENCCEAAVDYRWTRVDLFCLWPRH